MEPITLKTNDGVELAALLWNGGAQKSALLLHMMPATKESWEPLADELYTAGFNVLAIDFRGHGESKGVLYQQQTPEEMQKYFIDARAGLSFLEDRYQHNNIVLVGASIGANILLQCMAHDHVLKKGVCLSAGLDYFGVRARDFIAQLTAEQKVLFVGAKDDIRKNGQNCGEVVDQLYAFATSQKEKLVYDTGGHGTDMWQVHEALIDKILGFIK